MAPTVPYEYQLTSDQSLDQAEKARIKLSRNLSNAKSRDQYSEQGRVNKSQELGSRLQQHRIFFGFVALYVVLYMSFLTAKSLIPVAGRITSETRKKCYGAINRQAMMLSTQPGKVQTHFKLPSGDKIPAVALGVWKAGPGEVGPAVKEALKVGYRHIDGAWIYGNEAEVGEAIRDSGVPRKDIWITSKLWNTFHLSQDVEPALDESLSRLKTDYVDLYLMHWPVAFKNNGKDFDVDFELTENPYPTWRKMEEMVEKGKVRNIGVSNFNIRRLQNLTANPLKIKPAVNQVELNYWNPQPELLKWSKDNGILLEAYSPFGGSGKVKETLEIPQVKRVAEDFGISPAQVYVSWHVQRGTVVLPKSVTPSRIKDNFEVIPFPNTIMELLEHAAANHTPVRTVDPSKRWGVDIWS